MQTSPSSEALLEYEALARHGSSLFRIETVRLLRHRSPQTHRFQILIDIIAPNCRRWHFANRYQSP
jgi:hypothetical protein